MKVATYNIHSCIDTRGVFDIQKTAEVIASLDADVVALQEVDAHKSRTKGVHQAEWLADRLGMDYLFYPVVEKDGEQYGLAILSRIRMQAVKLDRLPAVITGKRLRELRGAMWVRLKTPQVPVNLVNTHLGLLARERRLQIQELLGAKWMGGLSDDEPLIFCGDLNAGRRSHVYRQVQKHLFDVQFAAKDGRPPKPTFFSYYPVICLDHMFVSRHFSTLSAKVFKTPPAKAASDHLPLVAELSFSSSCVIKTCRSPI